MSVREVCAHGATSSRVAWTCSVVAVLVLSMAALVSAQRARGLALRGIRWVARNGSRVETPFGEVCWSAYPMCRLVASFVWKVAERRRSVVIAMFGAVPSD